MAWLNTGLDLALAGCYGTGHVRLVMNDVAKSAHEQVVYKTGSKLAWALLTDSYYKPLSSVHTPKA